MRNRDHVFQHIRATAAAACLLLFAAVAAAQTATAERVFSGTVGGKSRIQMRLRREGQMLSGSYFYERVQKNLNLSGEIDAQDNFTLREYDSGGAQTGVFKGKWYVSNGEDRWDSLNGNWSRPDGSGSVEFYLNVYAVDFRGPLKLVTRTLPDNNRKPNPPYEIAIDYPQITGSTSPSVVRFNEMMRRDAMKGTGHRIDPSSGYDSNNLSLGFDVGLANDDLVSIEVICYVEWDAGRKDLLSKTINYDLKRGRLIKFEELFRPGVDYLKLLSDYCVRDLKNQWGEDEMIQDHVKHVVGDQEKVLITPKGLAFIFDRQETGPPDAAATRVIVTYAELRRIIRIDGPLSGLVR